MIFFILFDLIFFLFLACRRQNNLNQYRASSFQKKKKILFTYCQEKKNVASFCSLFVYFLCFTCLLFMYVVFLCVYC